MKMRKILCAVMAFAMILSTTGMAVSAEETAVPTEGYYLTIYNEDGTVGFKIDGTKSASPFRLSSSVKDADVFVDNAFLFGIKGTPTYEIEVFQDSIDDEPVEFNYSTVIKGNGHSMIYTGAGEYFVCQNGVTVDAEDYTIEIPVADVNGTPYKDADSAIKAAASIATEKDPAVVNFRAGEFELGNYVLPNMEYVTFKGAENGGTVLKNTVLTNAGKASDYIANITFDGIVFDNSRIYLNGWTKGMNFAAWTITNCDFKNLESATSVGGVVQFNLSSSMIVGQYGPYNDVALDGFVFTHNTVSGAHCNGVCSAINSQAMEGTIVIENNVFDDIEFNAIQLQNVPETATVSIKNNTFTGIGRQIIHLNNNVADITVNKNVFVKTSENGLYISHLSTKIDASENFFGIGTNVDDAVFDENFANAFHMTNAENVPVINTHYENTDFTESVMDAEAKIGDTYYKTLKEALAVANNGDVVYVAPGTYTDEIVVNKSIVLTGDPAYGADAALMAVTEKPVIKINNVTNGGVKYYTKNVVFDNLVFDVVENAVGETWNVSALGYYYENTAPKEGLTVTNCDFINNSDISMSAIAANISKYTVKNNTFKNFTTAVHSFVDHGAVDEVVISGNKFAGVENIASVYYGAPAAGNATIAITDNKSTDGSVAEIHVDDFGQTKATPATAYNKVTVSGNDGYLIMQNYGTSNFTLEESGNADDAVYSYKTEEILSRMANDVPQSNVYVQYGTDAQQAYVVNADGTIVTAEKVELVFVKNTDDPEALDNSVWELVLRSADDELINRLNSADFTFSLTSTDDMDYEIVETNDEIEINNVNNLKDRYEFHFKNKNNVADTATEITIGQVRFTGYGPFLFLVDDADTNAVHATTLKDNIVASYAVNSLIVNSESENLDGDDVFGTVDTTIEVPTKDLTVNIAFPNAVENKEIAYQDMKVVVSGDDLAPVTVDLGSDAGQTDILGVNNRPDAMFTVSFRDGGYVVNFLDALTVNTSYDITVSGAGYRTARYTVRMTDNKTVNFWNNVKDADAAVEEGKAYAKLNYLAGDIVKDNKINTYDLSAVVSYFGETDLSATNNKTYAKYDLNRDGFIDSKDVAIVLVSWGN